MNSIYTAVSTPVSISDAEAKKLEKYRDDCGCGMGALFFIASIVFYLSYLLFIPNVDGIGSVRATVIGVVIAFISSIIGKSIGIGIARIRYTLLIRSIKTRRRLQGE